MLQKAIEHERIQQDFLRYLFDITHMYLLLCLNLIYKENLKV